jgi:hypothetical protein
MDKILYVFVWLCRIHRTLGFGIQSPTDFQFVRDVINEHRPYYRYDEVGQGDDWLTRRLGRLYFRLANWRQPSLVISSGYADYLHAGCATCSLATDADEVEMAIVSTDEQLRQLLPKCNSQSLLVLDRLHDHRALWYQLVSDRRVTITYDLYYCGIVLFDPKRSKQHYHIIF